MTDRFDHIILGAGAAGLSLAYQMVQAGLSNQRILLVERQTRRRNDRTWCFWERTPGPFDHLVSKRWNHIHVHGEGLSRRLEITPHTYKMIRGEDFYAFMDEWVAQQPNITRVYGEAHGLEDHADGASVRVGQEKFEGRWLYSSLYTPSHNPGYHSLLQHFKGWVIETPTPAFDPNAATFMDFRVPQQQDSRFVYVLPTSEHRALIEYTAFSPALFADHEYDQQLEGYIQKILGLNDYRILEVEQGLIPMTDAPFNTFPSPHTVNIGMAGGCTKASTGYTFRRIQAQAQHIVAQLVGTGTPQYPQPRMDRHRWMDSVFLRVLETEAQPGHQVFTHLLKRNPIQRVLEFLNEDSSMLDELALMSTMNTLVFSRAGLEVTQANVRRWWTRKTPTRLADA